MMSVSYFPENVTDIYNVTFYDDRGMRSSAKHTVVVPALMFAAGTIGNILAISVLIRSASSHKWKIFYRLVGALAITDLFGIVTTSPVTILTYANHFKWVGGQTLCDYFSFILIFAGFATVFIVGAMSLDRYIAVCFPYYYKTTEKKRHVNVMIVCLWIISILIACLPLIGLGSNVIQYPGTWCFFNFFGTKPSDLVFSYFYSTVGIFMIALTVCLNLLVFYSLYKHHRHSMAFVPSTRKGSVSSTQSKTKRANVYIMILLVAIVIIFGACWTPLMVRILINQSNFRQTDKKADLLVIRMASFNQILDPWVYILLRKEVIVKVVRFVRHYSTSMDTPYQFANHSLGQSIKENKNDDVKENSCKEKGKQVNNITVFDENIDENKNMDGTKLIDTNIDTTDLDMDKTKEHSKLHIQFSEPLSTDL